MPSENSLNIDFGPFAEIAKWALGAALMLGIMGWLAAQRTKPDNDAPPGRLHHPAAFLTVGVVCAIFFSALAVLSVVLDNGTSAWWVTGIFIAFVVPGVLMVIEYFRVRHECTSNGLTYARLFGQGGFIGWHNVSTIIYSDAMKWFRITANTGEVARVSAMQKGLPHFAGLVLEHVPHTAIDEDTMAVLEQTAAGKLPSIWA